MLNPTWLKTFITLIDTGHFTQTAEKLFMTQPGVSQHINKLEQACQHRLINREGKSFTITEQGRLVYNYAKRLVENERGLMEQLAFDAPYSGDCTLACSGSIALLLYPKLLTLQVRHTKLSIQLKAAPNHQILTDINQGTIDQGIVTDIPNKNIFDAEQIGKEELCLVLPENANTETNIEQLLNTAGLISHPDAEYYLSLYIAQSEEQELKQIDIKRIPVVGFINQISQILHPISEGIGFTVLPKSALDSFHAPQRIKVLKPNKPVIETLYLVKKRNRSLPERYKIINSVIQSIWQ